jgi:tryptophanyl-tRNA synthetase
MTDDSDSTTVLTGIKPTGEPHLGHWIGAIEPALEMAREPDVEPYFFMADYHALTTTHDPEELEEMTYRVAAAWLALGLDLDEMLFYRQSDVPEIFELTWVLSCFTSKGLMNRAHAYKDAVADNLEHGRDEDEGIDMGLYTYPVLMAADILIFEADEVPVGGDQIQHVEIARDVAGRFNHTYDTDFFTLPEHVVPEGRGAVPGVDGRKMSNSYDNYIPLFADSDDLKDHCMAIETDSTPIEEPMETDDCNVFQIYQLFADDDQIEQMRDNYQSSDFGYGHAKLALFELLDDRLEEPRERFNELMADTSKLDRILEDGAEQARSMARPFVDELRRIVGIDR